MENFVTIKFVNGKKETFPVDEIRFEVAEPRKKYRSETPITYILINNVIWYRNATQSEIDYYKLHEGE